MKFIKGLLMISLCIFLLGATVFLISFGAAGWDPEALSAVEKENVTHKPEGNIKSFELDMDSASVSFKLSEDDALSVVCNQSNKTRFSVRTEGDILEIEEVCAWYNRIFNWTNYSVTIYLPVGEYGSLEHEGGSSDIEVCAGLTFATLDIESASGDIKLACSVKGTTEVEATSGCVSIAETTFGTLSLDTTSGDVYLSRVTVDGACSIDLTSGDITASDSAFSNLIIDSTSGEVNISGVLGNDLYITSTSGDIELYDVLMTGRLTINGTSSDIEFERCDAKNIEIVTTSGDIEGSFLTPKSFDADTTSGDERVPYPSSGDPCRLRTTSGDIEIFIVEKQ